MEPEGNPPRTKARNHWKGSGQGQEPTAGTASSRNNAVGRNAGVPAAGDGRETAAGLSARAAGLEPTANIDHTRPSYEWRGSNRPGAAGAAGNANTQWSGRQAHRRQATAKRSRSRRIVGVSVATGE